MKTQLVAALMTSMLGIFAIAPATYAADTAKKPSMKEPTKEDRQKMAAAHSQMAACLTSDKPMKECRKEMMMNHKDGDGSCPMMGGKGHHMDHGHDDEGSETK